MEKLKGVPLESQGISLPRDFPYEGEWLLKDKIFLYRSNAQGHSSAAELTIILNYGRDDWCFGIDAVQLADGLQIQTDKLFEHNRACTLYLVRADDVPATRGGLRAKRYIFQIGDGQAAVFLEDGLPTGSA